MGWLKQNSEAVQAVCALAMALVAIAALIGVKYQIEASYQVQREQSAKEIYRELLNISIANPDYAAPDYCALKKSPKWPAYESYVEYTLYTAEQMLEMDPDWKAAMQAQLETHAAFVCAVPDWSSYSAAVAEMAATFRAGHCETEAPC